MAQDRRQFTHALLRDLHALGGMLTEGRIESGVRRIGAEQEMFLVDRSWRPAPVALELLDAVDDPHFVTEVGAFNLEVNLDPQHFSGDCFTRVEAQLNSLLDQLRAVAGPRGVEVLLAGILPTIRKSDLGLSNMVDSERYRQLNEAISNLRGHEVDFYIKGIDELRMRHDSVMVEACNASFQVHLQVDPVDVRQPVQHRPGAGRAGAGLRHQLTPALRPPAVGRDPHRRVPAVRRHPPAEPSPP